MKKGVVSILSAIIGAAAGASAVRKVKIRDMEEVRMQSDKYLALFLMMNQWVKVKQEGKSLAGFFKENNYNKIAIYGMGCVGETLLEELSRTEIKVAYAIDRNAASIFTEVDVVSMEDNLEEVDAVVVTAITFFDEIEEELSAKMDCPIFSLEDILYEV